MFQILISDNGTPALSSTTRVVVKVEDINDNAPEFEQVSYDVQIPASNTESDQPMFQVSIILLLINHKTILESYLKCNCFIGSTAVYQYS